MELSGEERVMACALSHLAVSRLSHGATALLLPTKKIKKGFFFLPLHFNPFVTMSLSNGRGFPRDIFFFIIVQYLD